MTVIPTIIVIDNQEITVKTLRLKQAKRLSMRISEKERIIKLTIPWGCPYTVASDFLKEREPWIANHLHLLKPAKSLKAGSSILIRGQPHTIIHAPQAKRGTWQENGQLHVSGFEEHIPRRVVDYLKKTVKDYASSQAHRYADILGATDKLKRISIRDTSSRWGSCSQNGTISLCWRLVLAPKEVLDYVIAHEVCHLIEMNHSPSFWHLVTKISPQYKKHRKWLKSDGYSLWSYAV